MAEISLKDVRKSFGRTEVIHGVSINIADGELIVIVGPSGCGKSTLLRMVAGLETVTAGDVLIGGRVVNHLEPRERDIAMVFQNYALYPHMSVFDNMAYGLKIARMPKAEIRERVATAAHKLQLEPFLARKPRELSGGQRQRVAMGRAVVRDPAAFLFDEPLSNLDAKLRVQTRIEIRALQRQLGTTSLYVTHDQVEAMTLADRMVVMNAGVAEQVGGPLEVYEKPATTFVAGFIGSPPMNFLPAPLILADGALGASTAHLAGVAEPDRATVGIRPEHLSLVPEGEGDLSAQVRLAEALDVETLIHLALPDGTELVARRQGSIEIPPPGITLGVRCEPRHLYVFDAAGKRVELPPL